MADKREKGERLVKILQTLPTPKRPILTCCHVKNGKTSFGRTCGQMDCEGSDMLLPVIAASVIDRLWNNNKPLSCNKSFECVSIQI